MLVGYVSDENFVALAGVEVEFTREGESFGTTSRASGSIAVDIKPGPWQVILSKPGYTSKRVNIGVGSEPIQFRLLSDRMVGFMWPKWVRCGETAECCIHCTQEFLLELWRYGWEKEFVQSYGWRDEHGPSAMAQLLPDCDFTQTGVHWNRTGYGSLYQKHGIVAPEQSGLYFLHAKTRDGEFCSFPWIVSPRKPAARIAVISSTITQNAYNRFGGRSNYFNQDGLPSRPIVNSRQDLKRYTQPDTWPFEETAAPLSFQRPEPPSQVPENDSITDSIAGRVESAFAPGEWRLLGWLERNGFEYDLYSETELHFERLPLSEYDVLMLNLHSEYWSPSMYSQVKNWVYEQQGSLMVLGGCSMYAEVEFQDESTMLCRREGEHTLRGESEAKLLGISYTHSGFQTGAPYQVLADKHWVFEKTNLKPGDLFGKRSLHERCPGGASAHELDKIGPESPHNVELLAKGTNPDDSGADLVFYETQSGGRVFSTGSLCWTLSLPIDEGVSAITQNVLLQFLDTVPHDRDTQYRSR